MTKPLRPQAELTPDETCFLADAVAPRFELLFDQAAAAQSAKNAMDGGAGQTRRAFKIDQPHTCISLDRQPLQNVDPSIERLAARWITLSHQGPRFRIVSVVCFSRAQQD